MQEKNEYKIEFKKLSETVRNDFIQDCEVFPCKNFYSFKIGFILVKLVIFSNDLRLLIRKVTFPTVLI